MKGFAVDKHQQHKMEYESAKAALVAARDRCRLETNKIFYRRRLSDLEQDEREWQERHKAA